MDILERLKFDATRCEATYSRGVASNIEEAAAEIERLRAALEFVRTDPCFKVLGTVTHDTVTDALGLTKILE